jgi:hypothetical protein
VILTAYLLLLFAVWVVIVTYSFVDYLLTRNDDLLSNAIYSGVFLAALGMLGVLLAALTRNF